MNISADPSLKTYLWQVALNHLGFPCGTEDNVWGPKTEAAYQSFLAAQVSEETEHVVVASTFADPGDVERFRRCKAQGKSDQECFKVGDNGIGAWGDDTTTPQPQCALPPEDIEERWGNLGEGRKKPVHVAYKEGSVVCLLTDRMPHKANITNGAGIDLNPGAVAALAIPKGGMVRVTWRWA